MREEQEIGEEGERGNRRESTGEKEESTGKTRITIPFKNHSLPSPRSRLATHPSSAAPVTGRDSGRPFSGTYSVHRPPLPPASRHQLPSKDSICKTPPCIIIIIVHGAPHHSLRHPSMPLAHLPPPFDGRGGVVSPPAAVDRVVHGPRLPSIPSFE